METFITSEDIFCQSTTDIEIVESTNITIEDKKTISLYELYLGTKSELSKTRKKKKCIKRKKEKKKRYESNRVYISQSEACELLKENKFGRAEDIRKGNNIRDSMVFIPRNDSAFLFGKTQEGGYVGKKQDVDGHIAIFGGSGKGKTTSLAIPSIHTWKGSIFAFDLKGDLIIEGVKRRKCKILYMLEGYTNSYYYDPFYFFSQDDNNLVQNARELAQALIPYPLHDNSFWADSAINILVGAIIYYFKKDVGFIDAIIAIKTTKTSELLKKIYTNNLAKTCLNPDIESSPEMLAGITAELHRRIVVFATDPLIQDIFSPSEEKEIIGWEDLESCDIFIRLDHSRLQQWGGVIRLMLIQLMKTLERRPEKYSPEAVNVKSTLLMFDEFPEYGKIDIITSAFATLRSKKVTIAIFCQSLADLDRIYGKEIRREICDNVQYKVILGADDTDTGHYFSELVGTLKVPVKGFSANYDELGRESGYSINISESREAIIQPHEFRSLKDIILLHPKGFSRIRKETYFTKKHCDRENLLMDKDNE